jgi:hypothetical protein
LSNGDTADALTEHQAVILDAIRLLIHVEVRGGVGNGKTFLAMEQGRRLAQRGQRVGVGLLLARFAQPIQRARHPLLRGT